MVVEDSTVVAADTEAVDIAKANPSATLGWQRDAASHFVCGAFFVRLYFLHPVAYFLLECAVAKMPLSL